MADQYADVIRLEGTETGLHAIQRAGQDAFATDTKKMIHKWAGGGVEKYSPDGAGLTGMGAADVSYDYGGWAVDNVEEALNSLRATTIAAAAGSGHLYVVEGMTGMGATGTMFPYNYVVRDGICWLVLEATTNYAAGGKDTLVLAGLAPEAYPSFTTRATIQVYDDTLITKYGLGQMLITPLTGETGAETGLPLSVLKSESLSGYPEYQVQGWTPTGIKGLPRQVITYPM